ncbi:hypothetical protein GCM10010302_53450 [Streptomyces polychromogenes]|uniref:Uncharacterized protein n=1 Tax=Streptomyces polychromogenes TaxID=67342 RepID=A0ABN0VJY5_9ACTN
MALPGRRSRVSLARRQPNQANGHGRPPAWDTMAGQRPGPIARVRAHAGTAVVLHALGRAGRPGRAVEDRLVALE